MWFNIAKCKIIHTGRTNQNFMYTMNGVALEVTTKERDIGVIITSNLNPATECAESAGRVSAILTQITRAFLYRDKRIFLQLYTQFVRSHVP